jgi:hypothetical protein
MIEDRGTREAMTARKSTAKDSSAAARDGLFIVVVGSSVLVARARTVGALGQAGTRYNSVAEPPDLQAKPWRSVPRDRT